jgi:hypothetical protein
MTFSYTAGGSDRDDVRLLIGDIDSEAMENARLEDEDIDRLLVLQPNVRLAAADAADILAAKFTRLMEGSSSGPSPSRTRAQELRATASRLRASPAGTAVPTAGGLTISSKQTRAADTDRVQPAFRRGLMDHP